MKLFLITALTLFTLPAFSATSATLLLKGVVSPVLSVAIAPESAAANLDLSTSQTDLLVGTMTERSNNSTGYTLSFSSANNGKLINGAEYVSYTLKYGTTALTFPQSISKSFTNAAPINTDLKISYIGNDSLMSGTYEDTVTVTITAN